MPVDAITLTKLSGYCDEFLVHGVEAEGKRCGILEDLVVVLGESSPIPVTYAGGVRDMVDLERVKVLGGGRGSDHWECVGLFWGGYEVR